MFLVRNMQFAASASSAPPATTASPALPPAPGAPARLAPALPRTPVAPPVLPPPLLPPLLPRAGTGTAAAAAAVTTPELPLPDIPAVPPGMAKVLPFSRWKRFERGLNRMLLRPLDQLSAGVMRTYLRTKGYHVRHVRTDLTNMTVYEAKGYGELPPLVLLHGIGGRPTDYYKMLNRLLYSYKRIIMPELPGHGSSKIRDKNAVIDHATFARSISQCLNQMISPKDPAIIFGHSLGGSFATNYALHNPDRVRAMVLASPTGAPFGAELPHYRELYSMRYLRDAKDVTAKAFGKPNSFVAHFAWGRLSRRVAQKMVMSDMFTRPIPPAELGGLRMPVLLLWGANDHLLPDSHIRYFAKHLPRGTVLEQPVGMTHNNPALGPYVVREAVARFAKNVIAKSSGRARGN